MADPAFDAALTTWVLEGELPLEDACLETPDGTPDTSTGQCLALRGEQAIRTCGPIVGSLPPGRSLDINLSLREHQAAEALLQLQLVDEEGKVLAIAVLEPGPEWERQRVSIDGNEKTVDASWLRLGRTGETGQILVDNIAMERLGGPEEGFVSLFNGKTLDGWVRDTEGYEVIDGAIRCKPASGGDLRTSEQYADFVLRFEFQMVPGANNGIAVRAPIEGNAAYLGMEIQVIDSTSPGYANLKPWQFHGSAYGLAAAERGWLLSPSEWNREEIRLEGDHLTVTLNGHVILDEHINPILEAGPPSGSEHEGARRTSGHIGFCGHGSDVAYRNIRIRPLGKQDLDP